MKRLILLCIAASITTAQADPLLTSWFTANSGQYARIYQTDAAQTSGTTSTTWSRGLGVQTSPVYADVNEINYSANWVYIRTSGLASHVMGPWYATAARTNLFINYPSNTASVYRLPRNPTVPATKTKTGGGTIGRFVNGVSFFDNRDAFSYVTSTATEVNPGDGIWARNAFPVEGATFDAPLAHQAGNNYHYHVQPIALRYQLGDHVDYNATANSYTESTAPVTQHSPILAWAADGFPIYGPYGYSDPTNAASGVRRMVSGFTLRDGTKGTTNLATTGRTTLPAWAAAVQNRSATLTAAQYGPAVSATFPLSRYLEDHDFLGDLGFTQTTGSTVRDFDLDKFNGRMCVTPDFPTPHFCYFTTINADGTPAYPYTIGRTYYGSPTGGASTEAVMTADTPLTQQFIGGANKALTINTPAVSGTNVTLTWSAVEGGTYSVDASTNQSAWTSKVTGIVSTGITAAKTYTALGTTGTEFGRVNRTALATYDTNGVSTATIPQTTTTPVVLTANTPPTISGIASQSTPVNTASNAIAITINDAETALVSLTMSGSSSNTTLVPNANIVFGGSGGSRTIIITPATNQVGTAIITVGVNDGTATTTTTFNLSVTLPAPTLTALPTYSQGTSKTITFSTVAGAAGYTIQVATVADFSSVLSTQNVASPSGTFTSLSSGTLYYYRVTATNGGVASASSNTVSSTQDASSPALAITAPATGSSTTHSSVIVSGTASDTVSGLGNLSVNGTAATTADGYAHWTATVPLSAGANSLSALAADNAGNTTTTSTSVTRGISTQNDGLPDSWKTANSIDPNSTATINGPLGDIDSDGRANLLEYAFNTDPRASQAEPLQSTTSSGFLDLSFPRRIGALDLVYAVEVSDDLSTWSSAATNFQVLSTVPDANGITETVVVRVLSPLASTPRKFACVRVTIQ